jgi:hypothetical protein
MKKRELYLVIIIVSVAAVGGLVKFGPNLLSSLDYSEDIAKLEDTLQKYSEKSSQYEADEYRYNQYIYRTGGTDADEVKSELHARIIALIEKFNLKDERVSPKTTKDRKTDLKTVNFAINAKGTWVNVTDFAQELCELPHVAQLVDLKLKPIGGGRRAQQDLVNISGHLEAYVVPAVRGIRKPALPDEPPPPRSLDGIDLAGLNPFLAPVVEPPPAPVPEPIVERPEPEPVGPIETLDPDRDHKLIRAVWSHTKDEAQIVDTRNKDADRTWLTVGDTLDGGDIILLHPLGAVVRRPTGTYVYPVGRHLADAVKIEDAKAFPEIRLALARYEEKQEPAPVDAAAPDFVGPPFLSDPEPQDATINGWLLNAGTNGRPADAATNGREPDGAVARKPVVEPTAARAEQSLERTRRAQRSATHRRPSASGRRDPRHRFKATRPAAGSRSSGARK